MLKPRSILLLALAAALLVVPAPSFADPGHAGTASEDPLDSVRAVPLPCEQLQATHPARSSRSMYHIANVCGFVGTDTEFQSRTDMAGVVHDYAFIGTMGAGFRIFDITDPYDPKAAGGYVDSGWENDVQIRGDIVVATYDGVDGEDSSASTCLKQRYPDASGQGVDIYKLTYNSFNATFSVALLTCIANPPGGAHNATLHPNGEWLGISNCCSDWALDVVDLRPLPAQDAVHKYRYIDESHRNSTTCPANATFTCVTMKRADGSSARNLWEPHDVAFSADGNTGYVAAINSTFIVDTTNILNGLLRTIAILPNKWQPMGAPDHPNNITISHQSDATPDGKILIVTDERGGGLTQTSCNQSQGGIIGAMHFFALAPIKGQPKTANASPATPVKLGIYVNPNPTLGLDPLLPLVAGLPRLERACTVHVFRIGGNGSVSPGEIAPGFGGVSSLGPRELTTAWYGGGVWAIDFSGPSRNDDVMAEDSRSTWGNTIGYIVMPGADTWAAKEYKGFVFASDILRGFDVYGKAF